MKIISIANQKGGVGKTTTTVNLAAGLAAEGSRVLCVDFDPQGNMSDYLGYGGGNNITITDLLQNAGELTDEYIGRAVCRNEEEKIDYIPADIKLSTAEMFLSTVMCRECVLRDVLHRAFFEQYDYIIIDCLPSLGIFTVNALAASNSVIIPVQMQKFSLDGIRQFTQVFNTVKRSLNPGLEITGILETMCENTNMTKAVDEALQAAYQSLIFSQKISRLSEAGNSTFTHTSLVRTKNSKLGEQYKSVVAEIKTREVS